MSTTPTAAPGESRFDVASTSAPAADASDSPAIVSRIVDVAQELVRTRGYNAFSYRDLSERVGIKTSSIHYHFPAKSDLALALVARYTHGHAQALAWLDSQQGTPACKLRMYLEMLCREFSQSNLICLCGMLATDAHSLPEPVQLEIRAFFRLNEEWLAQVLDAGRACGDFRFQVEAQSVATSLFATMQGAMISAYTFGDAERLSQAAAWAQESLRAS